MIQVIGCKVCCNHSSNVNSADRHTKEDTRPWKSSGESDIDASIYYLSVYTYENNSPAKMMLQTEKVTRYFPDVSSPKIKGISTIKEGFPLTAQVDIKKILFMISSPRATNIRTMSPP